MPLPVTNQSYKPVVIIHGISAAPSSLSFFTDYIIKRHPGTQVTVIDRYNYLFSYAEMWKQVNQIKEDVSKLCLDNPDGLHLIGYSQGGLIARAVVETLGSHTVDTFISMAGPQNGQYGKTDLRSWLPRYNWVKENFYRLLYSKTGQMISFAGYWKDPYHIDEYLEFCQFLPIINNEVEHIRSAEFKDSFLKLKKMVLIGSMNDTTVTPWQSTQFGFYDKNEVVVLMNDQEVYTNDSFGLRTMDERGDLVLDTVTGIDHDDLGKDASFIENHILPWLS